MLLYASFQMTSDDDDAFVEVKKVSIPCKDPAMTVWKAVETAKEKFCIITQIQKISILELRDSAGATYLADDKVCKTLFLHF